MVRELILCKGLPASGKSQWAKEHFDKHPGKYKLVTKDDLRLLLDNGKWSKDNEQFVLKIRDTIIKEALLAGNSVIVADTNLDPSHEKRIREIVNYLAADIKIVIKDFTDVDPKTCIERDLKRPNRVGHKVIMDMYNRYLNPKGISKVHKYVPHVEGLPLAIIFDIDGTLACMVDGGRSPYDWHRVGEDLPHEPVIDLLKNFVHGYNITHDSPVHVIIVSGRDEVCRSQTTAWLKLHGVEFNQLFMRPEKNNQKDVLIKREIYFQNIENKYNVLWVADDRNSVIADCWRDLNLPTF